jgi:hypothetical protein
LGRNAEVQARVRILKRKEAQANRRVKYLALEPNFTVQAKSRISFR